MTSRSVFRTARQNTPKKMTMTGRRPMLASGGKAADYAGRLEAQESDEQHKGIECVMLHYQKSINNCLDEYMVNWLGLDQCFWHLDTDHSAKGNANDELEICLESGDPDVESFEGTHLVFVGAGSDPFEVITNSVKAVERHLQTFSHREKKKMPDILNWFGWCTWDAFYTNVTAEGVKEGLQSFQKGGLSPKFVIIDDGWQLVGRDPVGIACLADNSANFANRLTHIKENHKFQKNGREGHREDDPAKGLPHIVNEIKGKHELKFVTIR